MRSMSRSRKRGDVRAGRGIPSTALGVIVSTAILVTSGLATPPPAAAYKGDTHVNVANEALALYVRALGPGANPEIADFAGSIGQGARDEDGSPDHVYAFGEPLVGLPWLAHFWDADRGPDVPFTIVGLDYPNAWQKARRLWAMALGDYERGQKVSAYQYLGHVAHMLADMSVPAHVHNDEHGTADDAYEDWMADNWGLSTADRAIVDAGPIEIPVGQPDKLYWLLHTTNQVADFFASDDYDGDAVDPAGWAQAELDVLAKTVTSPRTKAQLANNDSGDGNADGDLGRIRQHSYLRAIRATAGLYGLFAESVGYSTTMSVVVNRVAEDNWHSHDTLTDPDYYARVFVDGGEGGIQGMAAENRGNYITNDVITPNWTFTSVIDPLRTQPLPVVIQIWDQDDLLTGADDQSDITTMSGRSLNLAVDVARCLTGTAGAVAGAADDVGLPFLQNAAGQCGVYTLLGVGNSSPASRLSFTISMTRPTHPTAAIAALPTWRVATSVPLRWSAASAPVAATGYDVRYRRAKWNGAFGSPVRWRSATTATSASFPASPGYTYCFSTRVRDADRGVSSWTAETCTAVPLDDRSLTLAGRWTAGTGSAYYRSTYLRSSTAGAKLTRTGVVARRIAIVATTCPTCGRVRVYWGSTLLKSVSLTSTRTVNRKLIPVTTFTSARSGTLRIQVVSSGRKVIIDGVAIRRN